MFGLENDILNKIYQILNKYKDNISWVKIFGSRAIGNYNLNSDIDIAICLKSNIYNLLKADMEESDIFYKVDLVNYNELTNNKLKVSIDKEGILIFDSENGEDIKIVKLAIKIEGYDNAIEKLNKSLEKDIKEDDLYLDAIIKRFEFSYELAWRLMKRFLSYEGVDAQSPRSVIREAFNNGLINNPNVWLDMLEKRNLSSHTYNQETAETIYKFIKEKYIKELNDLKIKITKYYQQ